MRSLCVLMRNKFQFISNIHGNKSQSLTFSSLGYSTLVVGEGFGGLRSEKNFEKNLWSQEQQILHSGRVLIDKLYKFTLLMWRPLFNSPPPHPRLGAPVLTGFSLTTREMV